VAATAAVDRDDRSFDSMKSVDVGIPISSRAGALLSCNSQDAPGATPGVATVTALIVMDGQDLALQVKVLVVGPPAQIVVTATPETVRCGEKAAITVEVADALRQPVSDLTRVEAVTNMGGILGGTGAVAGQAGPVVPVSSTVAETFGGRAAFYLLTSDLQTGPYQVVVATGGAGAVGSELGGRFSTPPIVATVSVSCVNEGPTGVVASAGPPAAGPPPPSTAPAAPPVIRPPSTGNGGLLP
jgi:hypothetical protein